MIISVKKKGGVLMFGVGSAPYMSPAQYNQMLQSGMNAQQFNPYNMYGNMGNQQNAVQNNQNNNMMQILKGRPVSGVEEARASMIDLDGSIFMFPDIANKMIYTKQINLNGEPEFKTYVLKEEAKQNNKNVSDEKESPYVLKDDFENIINTLVKKIKALEGKKYVADVQHNGADADEE